MTPKPTPTAALLVLLAAAGCAGTGHDDPTARVTRTMLGDTTVVRTESGSAWGAPGRMVEETSIGEMDGADEYIFGQVAAVGVGADGTIYVVDRQVSELRAYDADGRYVRTIGRKGEGPGELKGPDGGLAVLSDGRIVVRDPGNARLQVYGPDGEALAAWPHRGGLYTGAPLWKDRDDDVFTMVILNMGEGGPRDWIQGLGETHPDGTPGDTLRSPDTGYDAPTMEARSPDNRGVSMTNVPFSANEMYAFHPDGWFVHGVGTTYRIRLLDPDAPLVIERAVEPVPVGAGEKAEEEARTTHDMRRTDPGWRWNGPAIPEVKPAFSRIFVGLDGRIWLQVPRPAVEVEDPGYDPRDPDAVEDRWKEPVAFDVFERDGTYLGAVEAPLGFSTYPTPLFDGDRVWAVVRDDLDVQRVVRFRVEHALAAGG